MNLIFLLVIIFAAWWFIFSFKKKTKLEQKKTIQRLLLYGGIVLVFILIATGRISAIFAAIVALIPWVERAYILKKVFDKNNSPNDKQHQSKAIKTNQMGIDEAKSILGIDVDNDQLDKTMIQHAYKRLIQKNHPDTGGSVYLSQQIVQARDILMDLIDKHS